MLDIITEKQIEILMILADEEGHALWDLADRLDIKEGNLTNQHIKSLREGILLKNTKSYFELHDLDVKDPISLAIRFRDQKDPLSLYIHERFSEITKRRLDNEVDKFGNKSSYLKELLDELNKLLADPSFYDEHRFGHVELTEEAKEFRDQYQLLEQYKKEFRKQYKKERQEEARKELRVHFQKKVRKTCQDTLIISSQNRTSLILLNRILLDEAYPQEIIKCRRPIVFQGEARKTKNKNSTHPNQKELPYYICRDWYVYEAIINNIQSLMDMNIYYELMAKENEEIMDKLFRVEREKLCYDSKGTWTYDDVDKLKTEFQKKALFNGHDASFYKMKRDKYSDYIERFMLSPYTERMVEKFGFNSIFWINIIGSLDIWYRETIIEVAFSKNLITEDDYYKYYKLAYDYNK